MRCDAIEFVTMLCDQVWNCTDRISKVFAQRLRQPPGDIAAMRILVRHLREDLSIPMNFVEQMRAQPPGEWHGTSIFKAFNNWSAQILATSKQLDDLHQSINYPLLREPVDARRDMMVVYQYHTEQAFLDRRVDELTARAFEFCAVARKVIEKKKRQTKAGDDHGHDHEAVDCPCCKRAPEQHRQSLRDPLQPIVLPAPPPAPSPPPPTPAPIAAKCCCAVPRMCQCARACGCVCQCMTTTQTKIAG